MSAPVLPPGFGPPQGPPVVASAPPVAAAAPAPVPLPVAGSGGAAPATAQTIASVQSNTPTLVMGPTGSGKSALIATLVRYVYRKYGKVTLIASCDGGGIPMDVQKVVAAGMARYWRMYTRDPGNRRNLAWDTMLKASQMWWPQEINPATGECPQGVALMPPMMTLFTMCCPNGHVVKQTTRSQELVAQICRQCNTLVTDANMVVQQEHRQPDFFKDVGALVCEGLTSMCAWGEEDLGNRAARGDLEGMKAAIGGAVVSGDFTLGQVTMSHVGFIQQQARTILLNSQGIPGLVVPPVFTALTLDAVTEGMQVCGPLLSGKAKTPIAASWVGNCLETEKREIGGGRYQFRLWLNQWKEPTGVIHLCKNRASPGILPDYLEDPPLTGGAQDSQTAFTKFSLGEFFEMLDAALVKGIAQEIASHGGQAVENRMMKFADPFADVAPVGQQVVPQPPWPQGPPQPPVGGPVGPPQPPGGVPVPPTSMPQPATVLPFAPTPPVATTAPAGPGMGPVAAPPTVAPPPGRRMAPPVAAPVPPAGS